MARGKKYYETLNRVRTGEKIVGTCTNCAGQGHERQDHGLLCGCWCNECFDKLVRECRSKSW